MPSQLLAYGCSYLVEGCRTIAYLDNSDHPFSPNRNVSGSFNTCGCCITPDAFDLPASGEFVSPAADPAPWYNAADERSDHYFGALILSWKETQPYLREQLETRIGGRAKAPKLNRKEVNVRFLLVVDDACAIPFAKAEFLQTLTMASVEEGPCSLPQLRWHECKNPGNCGDPDYSIRGFPLAVATKVEWVEDEVPSCLGLIAEVTFTAELPWVYELTPEVLVEDLTIIAGVGFCTLCPDTCPPESTECVNENAATIVDPPAVTVDGNFCEPAFLYTNTFVVADSVDIGDDTLEIIVSIGSTPMRNLRIKAWPNPLGLSSAEDFLCETPDFDIALPGPFPADSIITIDGKSRSSTLICNGVTQNGRNWIESPDGNPFSWPDVSTDGLLIVLESSAMETNTGVPHTASDAKVTVNLYHRELR